MPSIFQPLLNEKVHQKTNSANLCKIEFDTKTIKLLQNINLLSQHVILKRLLNHQQYFFLPQMNKIKIR